MPRFYPFPKYPAKPDKYNRTRIKIKGKHYSLGKHGTPESMQEYARLASEHAAGRPERPKLAIQETGFLTIQDLAAAWSRAQTDWTHEQKQVRYACLPLLRLYGATKTDEFSTIRLKAVREAMITQSWVEDGEKKRSDWSRNYVNTQINRIVRVFRWAESEGLAPKGLVQHLRTLIPLSGNDRRVRRQEPKECVNWTEQVEPVLAIVSRQVEAITRLQYLAGMRPQDAVKIRPCDLDPDGPDGCWLYRPSAHKGQWRGHELVKVLSPAALAVLKPWLDLAKHDAEYLFPPHKRDHGQHISVACYSRAVAEAVATAGVKKWTPANLRHTAAMEARRIGGDSAVKAFLGHEHIATAKEYGKEMDLQTAAKVAKLVGSRN